MYILTTEHEVMKLKNYQTFSKTHFKPVVPILFSWEDSITSKTTSSVIEV